MAAISSSSVLEDDRHRAARAYISRGWPVFVLSRSKTPLANCEPCRTSCLTPDAMQTCGCLCCHGFYAATLDPGRIAQMLRLHPSGLLAVRTGAAAGLVVLDVDPRHGGQSTLAALDAERLLPGTTMVVTGSGGLHMYYAHPGERVPSGANRLGIGIDVKADGGYVVAPPSRHPATGSPYRWCPATAWHDDPAPLDDRLRSLLVPLPVVPLAARRHPLCADAPARLVGLLTKVIDAPEGQRNAIVYWAATRLGAMHAEGELSNLAGAVAALREAALWTGLADSEVGDEQRGTIASGLRTGHRQSGRRSA